MGCSTTLFTPVDNLQQVVRFYACIDAYTPPLLFEDLATSHMFGLQYPVRDINVIRSGFVISCKKYVRLSKSIENGRFVFTELDPNTRESLGEYERTRVNPRPRLGLIHINI